MFSDFFFAPSAILLLVIPEFPSRADAMLNERKQSHRAGWKYPESPPTGGHGFPSESRPAGAGDSGYFHSANVN